MTGVSIPENGRAYVVLTGDEKQDILHPRVVGPFDDDEAAIAWVAGMPNAHVFPDDSYWPGAIVLSPPDGGYAGFAIVSDATATSPDEYAFGRWTEDDEDD